MPHRRGIVLLEWMMVLAYGTAAAAQLSGPVDTGNLISILFPLPIVLFLLARQVSQSREIGGLDERTKRAEIDNLELSRKLDAVRKEEGDKRHMLATETRARDGELAVRFTAEHTDLEGRMRELEKQMTQRRDRSGESR